MDKKPLISIIMNCFNGERYLDDSLKSILSQTYQNWELIFWDNLSTDNSKKIFLKYKDSRFKYYQANEHTILYVARNLAIKKANGEFIAFLDTDDIWLKNKLSEQISLFANKNVGLVVGATAQKELESIRSLAPDLPFLIPGVGAQGGDLYQSVKIGNKNGTALINISRGISFAGDMSKTEIRLEAKKYVERMREILNG